ncbi:hypothetical protein CPAV1605_515 [seawater metagenome]|uniref:Uncharacterized protein n=1 Tax=seawater metagenome TaxID=1561972 RepID=A0A5E8CM36_9ZZZZ
MNNRKKENRAIIDSLIDRGKVEKETIELIDSFKEKYEEELKDYNYVDYDDFLLNVRKGGYIRYVNLDKEIRWGGILIKIEDLETRDPMLTLMNTDKRQWKIKFSKNYVFYRKHRSYNDRLREVFLSYLE